LYSPSFPTRRSSDLESALDEIVRPTLRQMAADGNPYTGFLYAGLVLTEEGPKVLEFNARLGDPETQVLMPRLESDLVDLIETALAGRPDQPKWSDQAAVAVVLAAEGYPESPVSGSVIPGREKVPEDVLVFHAGTKREGQRLVTAGGRVLDLVGMGATITAARERVYFAVEHVRWKGMQYRKDIAAR